MGFINHGPNFFLFSLCFLFSPSFNLVLSHPPSSGPLPTTSFYQSSPPSAPLLSSCLHGTYFLPPVPVLRPHSTLSLYHTHTHTHSRTHKMSPAAVPVSESSSTTRVRRIVLLGARAVGKSSMIAQYVDNVFDDSYLPTISDNKSKFLTFRGQNYEIQILDTAGQDEFSIFNGRYALDVHGYVLVYSVTSKQSFDMISIIRDKILNFTGTDWVPLVIVGNKTDLQSQRQVSKKEGEDLAVRWKCLSCETSAKLNSNIERAFELMMNEIEKSTQAVPEEKKDDICLIQ